MGSPFRFPTKVFSSFLIGCIVSVTCSEDGTLLGGCCSRWSVILARAHLSCLPYDFSPEHPIGGRAHSTPVAAAGFLCQVVRLETTVATWCDLGQPLGATPGRGLRTRHTGVSALAPYFITLENKENALLWEIYHLPFESVPLCL